MALNVKIRMEQADMPAGLMKMLSVLDQSVASTPVVAPAAAETPATPSP
jgi:hypothetical protein